MSQYEFDNNQEGDWEENEDIAWNEAEWQNFLRKSEKEVTPINSASVRMARSPMVPIPRSWSAFRARTDKSKLEIGLFNT